MDAQTTFWVAVVLVLLTVRARADFLHDPVRQGRLLAEPSQPLEQVERPLPIDFLGGQDARVLWRAAARKVTAATHLSAATSASQNYASLCFK